MTIKGSGGRPDAQEFLLIVDVLTKAVLQSMQATSVDPLHTINLCCQSIDNVLSALLMSKGLYRRDHGAKLQHFGNEYIRTKRFPPEKGHAVKRSMDLWRKSRYGQKLSDLPLGESENIRELCDYLLDFAIKTISAEYKYSEYELLAKINSNAENRYFTTIHRWKPNVVPGYLAFEAFEFIGRIREDCRRRNLVGEYDVGFISGLTHAEIFGLPHSPELTEFEREALSNMLSRLKQVCDQLRELKDQIEFRKETGQEEQSYSLRWGLAFDHMVDNLRFALEDDVGLDGLATLCQKWGRIIDNARSISAPSMPRHLRALRAKAETKKWFLEHAQTFWDSEDRYLETWSNGRELRSWSNIAKEDELNRMGIVVTPSPLALERFGGRIENQIMTLWKDFSPERVRQLLLLEERGEDIMEAQRREGVRILEVCPGLRDLAYQLRRRGLSAEEEDSLPKKRSVLGIGTGSSKGPVLAA